MTQRQTSASSASISDSDKGRNSDVKPLLVLLEIGQSPQPEMEAEFRHFLGRNCDILTLGALDHLDKNEITRHPPVSGDDTLYTTLPPDNSPVLISKQLVIDGFRRRMDELKDIEAPVKILCCTGGFPEIETSNILMASDIITGAVRDKVPAGSRLGVFIPDKDQVPEAIEQWGQEGYEVSVVALSPEASDDAIEAAAHCMRDLSPDAILYDCMGYSHKLQTKVEADSSHKCNKRFRFSIFLNQLREYLPRGLKPQAFARPMVHLIDRGAHLVLAELVEGHAFGEVLA